MQLLLDSIVCPLPSPAHCRVQVITYLNGIEHFDGNTVVK